MKKSWVHTELGELTAEIWKGPLRGIYKGMRRRGGLELEETGEKSKKRKFEWRGARCRD